MKKILLSLIPVGAMAGIVLSGLPASAATIQSNAATTECVGNVCGQCSGDICAQVTSIYRENRVSITAWAYDANFTGGFAIATPDRVYTSPVQEWLAGGGSAGDQVYSFITGNLPDNPATITATALETLPVLYQIGQVSFSVAIDPY